MNLRCIHAYTEPDVTYPAYVSLNTDDKGVHKLTVRSPAHNGMMSGTIELTEQQLVRMAQKIMKAFPQEQ